MDSKIEAVRAQLMGMRHQIAALASAVEAALMQIEEEKACKHPNKIDMSTFEGEEWHCPDCGAHYIEEKESES